MTIGDLSRRAGVPVKVLRRQQDLGLIYTRWRPDPRYGEHGRLPDLPGLLVLAAEGNRIGALTHFPPAEFFPRLELPLVVPGR